MAFSELTLSEQTIILQCMNLVLKTRFIENPEFQTRLGINRRELREVIAAWPELDDSGINPIVNSAINNCLNEVCNGLAINAKIWKRYFDVSPSDVREVFHKWRKLKMRQRGIS